MTYSKEAMESTIEEVKTGASSIRGAARKYGISSSTLHDHLSEKHTKVSTGGPTVLTYTEEREIVLSLIALREMGFGLTKDLVDIMGGYRMLWRLYVTDGTMLGSREWQLTDNNFFASTVKKEQHLINNTASCMS